MSYHHDTILSDLESRGKVPSREKFRRMICQTFLSNGCCPYYDKCVFLHDPLIKIENIRLRPNRQQSGKPSVNYGGKDSFYWPDMERKDILQRIDPYTGLPDPNQSYVVPQEFRSNVTTHDRALYSMWNHFVETCQRSKLIQLEDCQHVDLLLRKRTGGCSCVDEKKFLHDNSANSTSSYFYTVTASNKLGSDKNYISRHYDDDSLTWVNKYLGEESESKRLEVFIKLSNGVSAHCEVESVAKSISKTQMTNNDSAAAAAAVASVGILQSSASIYTTSLLKQNSHSNGRSSVLLTKSLYSKDISHLFSTSTNGCQKIVTQSVCPISSFEAACMNDGHRDSWSTIDENVSFASVASRSPSPAKSSRTSATSTESSDVKSNNRSQCCPSSDGHAKGTSTGLTSWHEISRPHRQNVPHTKQHHMRESECTSPISAQSDLTIEVLSTHFDKCGLACNH